VTKPDRPKASPSEWLPGAGGSSESGPSPARGADREPPRTELSEFGARIDALERKVEAMERRAIDAEERARQAEIREQEAQARAERAEARAAEAERSGGAAPPRDPGQVDASPAADPLFDQAARQTEETLREIERRIATAGDAVRELAEPGSSASAGPAAPDINAISFEQLREVGLSVTQAARVLARRDSIGGFGSFDELNDIAGIPREVADRLKRHLSLD
jgi:DNA uptake protein ComE-like DNA-binding protein